MNIRDARNRLKEVSKEIEQSRNNVSVLQKRLSALEKEQIKLTAILNAPSEGIGVSDHALVRFLERKYGFDFTPYREEILTPERILMIRSGATTISVDGVKLKIDKNTVVTVI